jgi:hypothetical protein
VFDGFPQRKGRAARLAGGEVLVEIGPEGGRRHNSPPDCFPPFTIAQKLLPQL